LKAPHDIYFKFRACWAAAGGAGGVGGGLRRLATRTAMLREHAGLVA